MCIGLNVSRENLEALFRVCRRAAVGEKGDTSMIVDINTVLGSPTIISAINAYLKGCSKVVPGGWLAQREEGDAAAARAAARLSRAMGAAHARGAAGLGTEVAAHPVVLERACLATNALASEDRAAQMTPPRAPLHTPPHRGRGQSQSRG